MKILKIPTSSREQLLDITPILRKTVAECGWLNGALFVYCQHTTCGLTINEGADPDVQRDLIRFFREIAPREHGWSHAEGNSDAHVRSSLLGVNLLIPIIEGTLALGRWQSVYLYEGDGPRTRSLYVQALAAI